MTILNTQAMGHTSGIELDLCNVHSGMILGHLACIKHTDRAMGVYTRTVESYNHNLVTQVSFAQYPWTKLDKQRRSYDNVSLGCLGRQQCGIIWKISFDTHSFLKNYEVLYTLGVSSEQKVNESASKHSHHQALTGIQLLLFCYLKNTIASM